MDGPMSVAMGAMSLAGVTLRYADAAADALADVSLDFAAGRVHWLFGRLGAGCSTLLLAAAGLAPRHTGGTLAGRIRLLGEDPQDAEGRRRLAGRVAYVTASPALQLSGIAATVFEEAAFAPANLGWPVARIRNAVDDALRRLGVAHLAARDPATLSGGELQRVVLAAMLALGPEVWLLDEPASALDPAGRRMLYALLRAEAARGATVLVASEDADALVEAADALVVLEAGRVAAAGAPRALLTEERVRSGPGSTSVAELAYLAGRQLDAPAFRAPYPLTVEDGVARWSR